MFGSSTSNAVFGAESEVIMTRLIDVLRAAGHEIPECEIVVADAIWAEIDKGENRMWSSKDFPNIAPPFDQFFVEAKSVMLKDIWGGLLFHNYTNADHKYNRVTPPGTRWTYLVSAYASLWGTCYQYPGFAWLHVGEHGEWLDDTNHVNTYLMPGYHHLGRESEYIAWLDAGALPLEQMMSYIPFSLMAISLMHCKNVTTEVQKPDVSRQVRRHWQQKHGRPLSSYRVLKIKPRGDGRAERDQPSAATGLTREHIARGHFKTFTEDKKLFGKWTGTYWWEPQLRGNPQRGTAYKDYEVVPDQTSK
jgi:hypothetical protein